MDIIKHLVGAQPLLAVLPRAVVSFEVAEGRLALIEVEGWPLARQLSVVRHSRKYVSTAMRQLFVELSRTGARSVVPQSKSVPGLNT